MLFRSSNLFELKGIIEEDESTIDNDLTQKLIINALDIALDNLIAMRAVEGSKIENNLLEKLDILTNVVAKIQEYAPVQVKNYRDKLRSRVQEALGDMQIDENKLMNEIVFMQIKLRLTKSLQGLMRISHILRRLHKIKVQ